MPFFNSNRPYTPSELVIKISVDDGVNVRTAKKRIRDLLLRGSLKKHTIKLELGNKEYEIVLYQYLGVCLIIMSYWACLGAVRVC